MRPGRRRLAVVVALPGALAWAVGCAAPEPSPDAAAGVEAGRDDRVPPPVAAHESSYRAFTSFEALATYLAPGPETYVSAHRGGPDEDHPENTLPTFERALGWGPMLIELDLRASADGRIVVLHDAELERATGVRGAVSERALEEIRALRVRTATGTATEIPVPTFREALRWAGGRAILRLDVKRGVTGEMVAAEVAAEGAWDRVMVTAEGLEGARRYRALHARSALSFWHDPDGDGRLSPGEAREVLGSGLDLRGVAVGVGSTRSGWDPAVLELLAEAGARGMVSTFGATDSLATAGAEGWRVYCPLMEARVGLVITDAPREAARAARECPAR